MQITNVPEKTHNYIVDYTIEDVYFDQDNCDNYITYQKSSLARQQTPQPQRNENYRYLNCELPCGFSTSLIFHLRISVNCNFYTYNWRHSFRLLFEQYHHHYSISAAIFFSSVSVFTVAQSHFIYYTLALIILPHILRHANIFSHWTCGILVINFFKGRTMPTNNGEDT